MDFKAFYQKIDHLLKTNKSGITAKFKYDSSDLIKAVRDNDSAQVAAVLNAWVNPNDEDGLARLALPIAVENQNAQIVGLLLRKKARPNVLGKDGQSPLFKAVYWENREIVLLLLDAGADSSFQNLDGTTPLVEALNNNYDEIADLLKNFDRDRIVKEEMAKHQRLQEKAQQAKAIKAEEAKKIEAEELRKKEELMRYQEKELQKNYKAFEGKPLSALLQAIVKKDTIGVRHFTNQVTDFNEIDAHFHTTPLMMAVDLENVKLAQFFLEKGANPTIIVNGQHSPLTKAIRMELYKLVKEMLEKTENTAEVLNEPTLLLSAQFLAYKNARMLNLLLEAGANPHYGGVAGISPIRKAIEKGSIAILPVLSRHKIDLDTPTDGKRPLEWAVEFNRTDWVNGLLNEQALEDFTTTTGTTLLEYAQSLEEREAIIALLEAHED